MNDGARMGDQVDIHTPLTMSRPFSSFLHGSRLRSDHGFCDSQRWSLPLWVSFLGYLWFLLYDPRFTLLSLSHPYTPLLPDIILGLLRFSLLLPASMPIIALD
jgi:hypothetical protein